MKLGRDVVRLFFGLTLLFGFMLGSRPLSVPDEGRYAEIPREMTTTGDYLTPRLNGVKYFEKPPLMYWMEAGIIKLFGLSEWALRLLPAFLGIIGCLWIFMVAHLLGLGREAAWASALTLATTALYYVHTRLLILDLGVTVFLSIALLSFLLAARASSSTLKNRWLIGFYGGSALAVLTKGIVGAVIPGMVILLWTLPWRRWDSLKLAFKPWGIGLFFLIAAPWHILVSIKNPEFPYFYFIHEHFIRFTTTEHGRFQPWWFFVPILLVGLFPWVTFLPQALARAFKELPKEVCHFLSLWGGLVFLFFSVSHSKLIPYILPMFPPLSLFLGAYLGKLWRDRKNTLEFVWGVQTFRGLCVLIFLAVPFILSTQELAEPLKKMGFFPFVFLVILIGGALIPGFFVSRGHVRATLISIGGTSFTLFIVLNAIWPFLEERTIKPLALTLKQMKVPEESVICYGKYYQDLPVYLNQTVKVVTWKGELSFGMEQEDTSSWMISEERFWDIWEGPQKAYALLRKHVFEGLQKQGKKMILLQETSRDVLVQNHP